LDICIYVNGGRVFYGHADKHKLLKFPFPQQTFRGSQLYPVVDTLSYTPVSYTASGYRQVLLQQDLQNIGKVVFSLGVFVPQGRQRPEQGGRLKKINAGVYLANLSLAGGSVTFLDNPGQTAIGAAHNPAVALRPGHTGRKDGSGGIALPVNSLQRI
jgi:hypothetical protein